MSSMTSPDTDTYAKRLITIYTALRSHVATKTHLNYPPGLSINQIKMIHVVFHRPGISQTIVAERLGVTTASISTSVRELEARGLIERRPNPDDARAMLLYLAPAGEALFAQLFDTFTRTFADILKVLPLDDQAQLVELLERALKGNGVDLDNTKLSYADKPQWLSHSASY